MRLTQPVSLHDIDDIEAFVHACLNASRIQFDHDEREELAAEGLCILYELASKYRRQTPGHNRPGRFSGWAAWCLPKKLGDAWHRRHPEHRQGHDPHTGKRAWQYYRPPISLDGLYDEQSRHDGSPSIVDRQLLDRHYWVAVTQTPDSLAA